MQLDAMLPRRVETPRVLVLFGGAGDLAKKKLLPALYNLADDNLLPPKFALLGSARSKRGDEEYRQLVRQAVQEHSRRKPKPDVLDWLLQRSFYEPIDTAKRADIQRLKARLAALDEQFGTIGARLFYLSTPPEAYEQIITAIGQESLVHCQADPPHGIVIEKPFGEDLNSASQLSRTLEQFFCEERVYRIDHYLGKETVQNLVVFRFSNAIFEPLLHRNYVHDVQITVAEAEGIAGRGEYYDNAGALRDMVQNHLLQLLCLVAMDPPLRFEGDAIRDRKIDVLSCIAPLSPAEVAGQVVRGQYAAAGEAIGYLQEQKVKPDSPTETYAALRLEVNNYRWAGVPFYLRTGKRLARKVTQVVVTFKHEPVPLLRAMDCEWRAPNRLIFRIQPAEGISIAFDAKAPGQGFLLRPVRMDFDYDRSFEMPSPEAYERLLLDALAGERSVFPRADAVEASWKIIDSIRQAWTNSGVCPLQRYPAGSWGPDRAKSIFLDVETDWTVI